MNDLLQKDIFRHKEDAESLFETHILSPYSEGNWITVKANPNLLAPIISSSSSTSTNNIIDVDEPTLPDRTLRGPLWDYGLSSPNKECCYFDLLYGKSRKTLLTQVSWLSYLN